MMVHKHWRAVAMALALVLGFVGCGGSDSDEESSRDGTSAKTTVPAGYIDVKDAEMGFSVAIPQDWRQVPFNADTLREQAEALRPQNPRMADSLLSARGAIGGSGKLFAIHPDGSSTVNLIVTDSGGAKLEEYPAAAMAEFRGQGATILSQERTSLGGTDAVKLTMRVPFTAETTLDLVQYYALSRGRAYILTLTGRDPALDVIARSMAIS